MKKLVLLFTFCIIVLSCESNEEINLAVVCTEVASSITATEAQLNGTLTMLGTSPITAIGFEISTDSMALASETGERITLSDKPNSVPTKFDHMATGLSAETTYYYYAFAETANGTGFGNIVPFTTANDPANSIKGRLSTLMEEKENEGFYGTIFIQKGAMELISNGYGFKNKAADQKNVVATIFDIGSLTKQFTAAAILKLEMQGLLQVEDKLSDFFDNVPEDKKDITIHQLLTHSAGFIEALGDDYDPITTDEYVDKALTSTLVATPGTAHFYTNVGYSILGILIEKLTGNTYEQYLRENLWLPSGMTKTGYILPEFTDEEIAHGYDGNTGIGLPNDAELWSEEGPYWNLKANGGILSNVVDLYKWDLALSGEEVLNEAAKEKLFSPHIEEEAGSGSFYGYGWVVEDSPIGTPLFWHDGGNGIFYAQMFRLPQDQITIIMLSNKASQLVEELINDIAAILFET